MRTDLARLIAPAPSCAFRVPGRIEVLGKHTDYAGGRSLLAALDRAISVSATARDDDLVTVRGSGREERIAFRIPPPDGPPVVAWGTYPIAVARRLSRNFPDARRGADIVLDSDLPEAAGLSSSSALITGVFLALATVNGLADDGEFVEAIDGREVLAAYLAAVEGGRPFAGLGSGRGAGTRGGAEDHVAILCARPGALVQYAFDPVRFDREVRMPAGCAFAIASSGVAAEKAGAALGGYNRLSDMMRTAARLLRDPSNREEATVGAAVRRDPRVARGVIELLSRSEEDRGSGGRLTRRVEQFLEESFEIVPAAAAALARSDLAAFGSLVDRSQRLAEYALGNQVPESVWLARAARELGAAAASSFGAGFGGSVWALIDEARGPDFLDSWRSDYVERFPARESAAAFWITPAASPAERTA